MACHPRSPSSRRASARIPRSTVGTTTEIHDYLRLLFARVGQPHCPSLRPAISSQTVQQMTDRVLAAGRGDPRPDPRAGGARTGRASPPQRARELPPPGLRARADRRRVARPLGGHRAREERPARHRHRRGSPRQSAAGARPHRGVDRDGAALAEGLVRSTSAPGARSGCSRSERLRGLRHLLPEIAPRMFSFNSPHGACPAAAASARRTSSIPTRMVTGRLALLAAGADRPVGQASGTPTTIAARSPRCHYEIDLDTPWRDLPARTRARGSSRLRAATRSSPSRSRGKDADDEAALGRRRGGARPPLQDGPRDRDQLARYTQPADVPGVRGLTPAPGGTQRARSAAPRHRTTSAALGRAERSAFVDGLELPPVRPQHIADRILREIRERLRFLPTSASLPHARPLERQPLRRRGPAHPARHPGGLELDGRPLHPRRAVDRSAPARQRACCEPRAPARPRQHRDRRRARRGHHPRRRSRDRHGPGRRHPRRRDGRRGPPEAILAIPNSLTGAYLSGRRRDPGTRRRRRPRTARPGAHRLPRAQPEGRDAAAPPRRPHGGDGRLGLGQVDAGQRHAHRARCAAPRRQGAAGRFERCSGSKRSTR